MPLEPTHDTGQSVTGAYEGWFKNADGTFSLLLGYYNRNLKEEPDIPVGPDNDIEPGGPDQGQPTHFLPRRQWGMFTVTVPKDFGDKKVTWTLVVHGIKTVVPAGLDPRWEVSPFQEVGMGNTPPVISFGEGALSVQGPRPVSETLTATAGTPMALNLWVGDDAKTFPGDKPPMMPAVSLRWSKFRGPGTVTFGNARPPVEKTDDKKVVDAVFTGRSETTATFSEAGEYMLHVVANDWSGEGGRGFQCCWTNALVKVSVKAAGSN
ncbi:MAG TPA: hypothetical protein VJO53_07985 [Candidatus Acidoferrales bacterium]|nr:hypothetical protein [Candidatus Acidoferrales bacterium]